MSPKKLPLRSSSRFDLSIAAVLLLLLFLLIFYGFFLSPYSAGELTATGKLSPPSHAHPLGTDHLGRDLLTRVGQGGFWSLSIAVAIVGIGAGLGAILGALAAYYGGFSDWLISRLTDTILAFPGILMALLLITVAGQGYAQLIVALGLAFVPSFTRIARGILQAYRGRNFVLRLEVMGVPAARIIFIHMLPLLRKQYLNAIVLGLANAILAESSLSFLGFGIPAPTPSWGSILSEAQAYVFKAPHYAILPGLVLVFTVFGFNMLKRGLSPTSQKVISSRSPGTDSPVSQLQVDEAAASEPAPSAEALLELQEWSLAFPPYYEPVLDAVSFQISYGEILGVCGESGSGKSLTGLSIMGLLPPELVCKGDIRYRGVSLAGLSRPAWQKLRGQNLGIVFQDAATALNPSMRIAQQVSETLLIHRKEMSRKERAAKVLSLFEELGLPTIPDFCRSFPHELSGGMRQRVALALALVNEPDLLLVDEPTSALDILLQSELLTLLRQFVAEGKGSVLFISHDLRLVNQLCDRVLIYRAGRIVESGTVEQVFAAPQHPYTKQLLQSMPRACRKSLEYEEGRQHE